MYGTRLQIQSISWRSNLELYQMFARLTEYYATVISNAIYSYIISNTVNIKIFTKTCYTTLHKSIQVDCFRLSHKSLLWYQCRHNSDEQNILYRFIYLNYILRRSDRTPTKSFVNLTSILPVFRWTSFKWFS